MTKKSGYKDSSKGKSWGVDLSFGRIRFLPVFLSSKFLENIFLQRKKRTDPDLIYQIGSPTLGSLSYLHVGVHLGGIHIKPMNGFGTGLGGMW